MSKTANWNADYGSVGPRIGFAYQMDEMTVFRGGYGVFYDPQANQGTTIRQERQWPFDLIYTLSQEPISREHRFPGIHYSSPNSGFGISSPFGTLKGIASNFKNASGSTVQPGCAAAVDSAVVLHHKLSGSVTHHLTWDNPLDQPLPVRGLFKRDESPTRIPECDSDRLVRVRGRRHVQFASDQLPTAPNHGFYLTANYVWAHALDNAPYDGGEDGPIPQNPYDRSADYGNSDNDLRSRLNVYGSYDFPSGREKPSCATIRSLISGRWADGSRTVLSLGSRGCHSL